ncbi:HAD-IA family hydrolase [Providencia rettgeri]|uniref:HAD-IA family hydrolase n=1 Tax=Moellerella wisconsensis TaxID=158849 RepID=A0ACD3YCG0_9GAMM|nr:HAD-IA family hydrolase [Moellerella wisconsensis]UNH28971.1 HAD-IA family hydrolase [Moellerella wisconsensis]UNH40748.1 HAD-IA family hydrolase [Moellerella wisconsensis]UNH44183.1 HAD-IA family hydrolase [Moellerella wisconsensis]
MIFMFDMGGVVANSSSMNNICNELGINEFEYRTFQLDSSGRNTYKQLSVGSITNEDYWKNFSINYKKKITQDYFKNFYNPIINNSVLLQIKKLKEKYRIICGTNTIKSHFDVHLQRGNYDVFDSIYSSHSLGVVKPNYDFFNQVITAEQVLAQNIFFVDDNKENIESAKKIGMKVHLFTSNENLHKSLSAYLSSDINVL